MARHGTFTLNLCMFDGVTPSLLPCGSEERATSRTLTHPQRTAVGQIFHREIVIGIGKTPYPKCVPSVCLTS